MLQKILWILTTLLAGIFTLERFWRCFNRRMVQDTLLNGFIALLFFLDVLFLSPYLTP